jgi:hypothetical protein
MWKQYVEHPFAEVGCARQAFVEAHPNGDGWSRGDILEIQMLSLGAQLVNVALTGVCAFVLRDSGAGKDALGVLMCCTAMAPVVYAVRILWQERRQQPQRRGADRGYGGSIELAERVSPLRDGDDLHAEPSNEASHTGMISSDAAKRAYTEDVARWLDDRNLGYCKDAILSSFDQLQLPPREWVSELNSMADDGVLDEFIGMLSRATAQPVVGRAAEAAEATEATENPLDSTAQWDVV